MRSLAWLDWGIVCAYLVVALAAGVLVARRAGTSVESYFAADRNLPWWWLGTSMVATTFAADTPLVVVGLVAAYGVAGNWFWWSWAVGHVALAVVFAALWRRARVLTDAELIELRYAGPSAAALRAFKAFFFAVIINGIVMGWVIRAMSKIAAPFVQWQQWLGADVMSWLTANWPAALLVGNMNDTLTVLALFGLITLYSSMGGIRGVILTDLLQFVIAISASIIFAVIAVQHVGGLGELRTALDSHYDAGALLAFVPASDAAWLPLHIFMIYIAVQWWAQYFSDGSGYLAQRLFTARSDGHAQAGALWFTLANYVIRTWPWILVGLVALVMYPLQAVATDPAAQMVAGDRELAYPVLMATLLPVGLLGLLFASLLAAFMSTIDTHINWGSAYLVNDLYRRFLRPDATQRELVLASRLAVVLVAVLAILVATRINSIEQAWRFFIALGAGLGLPGMLRWLWWRINAWTEIVGMISAFACAIVLYSVMPDVRDEYLLLIIVGISMTAAALATAFTEPVPREHLQSFVSRVRPPGWWNGMAGAAPRSSLLLLGVAWLSGNAAVFGLMFAVGHFLFGRPFWGLAAVFIGSAALVATILALKRVRREARQTYA